MLKTRILTAAVLLPLVVAGILLLPTLWVAGVLGVVLAIGAWEWAALAQIQAAGERVVYALATALLFAALWYGLQGVGITTWVLALAALWWALAIYLLTRFPHGLDIATTPRAVSLLIGWLSLAGPFVALCVLHASPAGPALVLWLFILIWAADTGAYFAGRAWGQHKLAPRVSPGKTWQGAAGGVVAAAIVAALGAWWFGYAGAAGVIFVLLGAACAMISIVGDLTVSMFKRQAGVKDSGNIFPGHGGVLDRLDSLLAAAPCFVLGWSLLLY